MLENVTPGPHGPLASVLDVRRGPDDPHTGGLEHREALIYTLGKAAELEHLVMLQYLFAAFSLKQSVDEGLTPETLGRGPALAQDAAGDQRAGDAPPGARAEPADGRRRRPAPRPAELPDARLRLPGRGADRADAVR